jgi:hypothetical protein
MPQRERRGGLRIIEEAAAEEKGLPRCLNDLSRTVTHPDVAMSENRATIELVQAARLVLAAVRLQFEKSR